MLLTTAAVLALPLQPALAQGINLSTGPTGNVTAPQTAPGTWSVKVGWNAADTIGFDGGAVVLQTPYLNAGGAFTATAYPSLADLQGSRLAQTTGYAAPGAIPPLPADYAQAGPIWSFGGLGIAPPGNPGSYTLAIRYSLPQGVPNPARLSIWALMPLNTFAVPAQAFWLPIGGTASGGAVTTTILPTETADLPGFDYRKAFNLRHDALGFAVLAYTGSYTDLQGYAWAKNTIDAVEAAGVMHGTGNGQFDPGGVVTRAQAATMYLGLAGGFPSDTNPVNSYGVPSVVATGGPMNMSDRDACPPPVGMGSVPGTPIENAGGVVVGYVPPCERTNWTPLPANTWYTPYVQGAVADHVMAGVGTIITAKGDGAVVFDPGAPMTKAQAVAALMQVYGMDVGPSHLPPPQATPAFADNAAIPSWAAKAVGEAVALGIVTGGPNGNFHPNAPVTRVEMAVMMAKMLALPHVGMR